MPSYLVRTHTQTSLSLMLARFSVAFLSAALALSFAACHSEKSDRHAGSNDKAKQKTGPGTPFRGEAFEASGVVFVPGTNGLLFIDDNKEDKVFWMQIDEAGQQASDA